VLIVVIQYSILVDAKLKQREVAVLFCLAGWQLFPKAHGIVADITDCATDVPKAIVIHSWHQLAKLRKRLCYFRLLDNFSIPVPYCEFLKVAIYSNFRIKANDRYLGELFWTSERLKYEDFVIQRE